MMFCQNLKQPERMTQEMNKKKMFSIDTNMKRQGQMLPYGC